MYAAINTADLDPLGNWSGFDEDTDGDATDDLTQSRTTNAANEITDITEGGGQTAWATPAYDRSGNMIEIPQPSDPANEFDATYDAWGRLVKLEDGANTVAEYEYDGLGRRIIKHVFDAGTFDYSDHAYYNGWQVVEVRRDTDSTKGGDPDADPMEQLVYHPYYIDAVAVRYWDDPDDGGGLDGTQVEQYYAHDAQFNVIALLDDTGTILERYRYTPYGEQVIMDASFDDDYDSDGDPTDNVSQYGQTKGFTGQTLDPESGLWYFRSRYYHSQVGTFLSVDSIGYVDGMSLRASYLGMLGGNDPLGHSIVYTNHETIQKQYNAVGAIANDRFALSVRSSFEIAEETGYYSYKNRVRSRTPDGVMLQFLLLSPVDSENILGTSGFIILYDIKAEAADDRCSCVLEGKVDFWAYAIAFEIGNPEVGYWVGPPDDEGRELIHAAQNTPWPQNTMEHELWHTDGNSGTDLRYADPAEGARGLIQAPTFPGYRGGADVVFEKMESRMTRLEAGLFPFGDDTQYTEWDDELCQIEADGVAEYYLVGRKSWILSQGLWHEGGSSNLQYDVTDPEERGFRDFGE